MPVFNEGASFYLCICGAGGGQSSFGYGGQAVPVKRVTLPVYAEATRPSFPSVSPCARV